MTDVIAERQRIPILEDEKSSAYSRYLTIFVGREGWWSLLKYEVLASFLGPMRGAPGYFLRAKLWPRLLGASGRGTAFGRSVLLRSPHRIRLGRNVLVDDGVVLDAKGGSSAIEIGDKVLVGRHSALNCNESTIRFGSSVSIAPFCYFSSRNFIDVGSGVSIGANVSMLAGGHELDSTEGPVMERKRTGLGITIEENCWIGAGTVILDGVRIGRNSVVGAGSVIAKDVPACSIVMGNPARLVQRRTAASQ
jgi:acetyltransferase-like isoleucine patch superfamily enzyme